jgi:hypothetical protein
MKAVALGARACRPGAYLYGLGGQERVDRLSLFDADVRIMALIGTTSHRHHELVRPVAALTCARTARGAGALSGRGGCRRRRCTAGR